MHAYATFHIDLSSLSAVMMVMKVTCEKLVEFYASGIFMISRLQFHFYNYATREKRLFLASKKEKRVSYKCPGKSLSSFF